MDDSECEGQEREWQCQHPHVDDELQNHKEVGQVVPVRHHRLEYFHVKNFLLLFLVHIPELLR